MHRWQGCKVCLYSNADSLCLPVQNPAQKAAEEQAQKEAAAKKASEEKAQNFRKEAAAKKAAEEKLAAREEELLLRERSAQQRAGAQGGVKSINFSELVLEDRPLTAGSFKTVYKAKWGGEVVAVLLLRSSGSLASEVAVFERLGRHPHLCRLLATSVRPQGEQCMVMEFAERGSLDGVLQDLSESGTVSPTHAVLLTAAGQVCEAMEQLGQHGIIHRDLAARNCLVFEFHPAMRRHVLVKVTDYGLAVAAGATTVTTNSGSTGGPMRWMAPESIKFRRYSVQSDVFS